MAYRRILSLCVVSLLIAGAACAAELGEPRIASFKGQVLVADIELSNLDSPAPVQVRVASPDVYRGASLSVPPALSSLQLSVVKQGGKQFVHVTSTKPVDTDMLLLFLELGQGANRDVRLATLLLTADPLPPPVAAAATVAPQAPPHPAPPVLAAVLPTPPVVAPAAPPPPPVARVEPRPELPIHAVAVVSAPLHFAAVSTALPASVRAAPAPSCKASATNQACVVLDTRNVALQAKLAGLESKIKLLEATLAPAKVEVPHVEAPAPGIVPRIVPIKPLPEPVAVVVKPKKHKAVEPAPSSTPWLWIAIAAAVGLAAIGAIAFLLLRRRAGKVPAAPSGPKPPGIMAGVRNRLMPAKVEPVAE